MKDKIALLQVRVSHCLGMEVGGLLREGSPEISKSVYGMVALSVASFVKSK